MKDKALKLALEALKKGKLWSLGWMTQKEFNASIAAIEEALAQPAHEPVGKWTGKEIEWTENPYKFKQGQSFYVAPQQRPWVGLTDEDWYELTAAQHGWEDLCLAVEAKLKEKNT